MFPVVAAERAHLYPRLAPSTVLLNRFLKMSVHSSSEQLFVVENGMITKQSF